MSRFSNSSSSSSRRGCRNVMSVFFSVIVVLFLVTGFIIFGPFEQIRDPTCKVTHLKFFCRGIINVQPVQVHLDTLYVGLSDGNFAFDIRDPNGKYKQQATDSLKAGNIDEAINDWTQAINTTTDDAESMVYIENARVAKSNQPYVTIVVATTLSEVPGDSSTSISVARDDLRGVFLAQRNFNIQHPNLKVRIVLANLGVKDQNYLSQTEPSVLQKIERLAMTDDTFIGVVGFPFSASAQTAIPELAAHHIPIISPSASSRNLTNLSPYFFRVVPSDIEQGQYAAQFASQVLNAHHVAVLSDDNNTYSQSLGDSFTASFRNLGQDYTFIHKHFTFIAPDSLDKSCHEVLLQNPPV